MIVSFEIVKSHPPNFEAIRKVFPQAVRPGVLFCWGNSIYNPSGIEIPDWIIGHENVHRQQQNGDPDGWWRNYIESPEFRLAQEIPAHMEEYKQFRATVAGRPNRRRYLTYVANRLSGPLYGNMLTFEKAKTLIKMGARNG